jgi:predicted acyl esterase
VVISEVRPDGNETYVQSGWLRASHRTLAASSTELEPIPTHTKADAAPLPAGELTLVRVPIFPVGHAFREGSRIRVVVKAPGGTRPRWAFDAIPADGDATVTIGRGGDHASRVVLPVADVDVTSPLPPCPSLRGQPCRRYEP